MPPHPCLRGACDRQACASDPAGSGRVPAVPGWCGPGRRGRRRNGDGCSPVAANLPSSSEAVASKFKAPTTAHTRLRPLGHSCSFHGTTLRTRRTAIIMIRQACGLRLRPRQETGAPWEWAAAPLSLWMGRRSAVDGESTAEGAGGVAQAPLAGVVGQRRGQRWRRSASLGVLHQERLLLPEWALHPMRTTPQGLLIPVLAFQIAAFALGAANIVLVGSLLPILVTVIGSAVLVRASLVAGPAATFVADN
jgi:hypothetical protein